MSSETLDVYHRLLSKADVDEQFRQKLLTDPRLAIEEELQITLPPQVHVTVEEATRGDIKLILPRKRALRESGELSDADLAQVAGGSSPCCVWMCCNM